jgi:hypothetical protein
MHIQARARVKRSTLAGGPSASVTAPLGLSDLLRLLSDEGYNLRSASGHDIERGGEFAFRVHSPGAAGRATADPDDDESDVATRHAIAFLRKHHVQVEEVRVFHEDLPDDRGALAAFVERVTAAGYPILEISVATPNGDDTIPVQIYTGSSLPEGVG